MRRFLPTAFRRKAILLLSLSTLALAGCGGGGEEGDSLMDYFSRFGPPPPIDVALLGRGIDLPANIYSLTESLFSQQRYLQGAEGWEITLYSGPRLTGLVSNPLRSSGAALAHAAGLTGEGAVIAVSDDQFVLGLDEFAGSAPEIVNNWEDLFPQSGTATGHGTIVSAVALGESADFIGTAPDAQLLFGSYETDRKLAEVGRRALQRGAVAWNNSWGYPNLFLNQTDFSLAFLGSRDSRDYLASLENYAAQGVVVFAVSNDNRNRHSTLMDGLPFMRPALEAGWIAAANGVPTLAGNGDVTAVQMLSSGCYEAARWCLIADGAWQIPDMSLQLPGTYTLVTGSSFAAPQISGALAILQEAFGNGPNGLTPHQLRVRLLASADDDFAGFRADDTVELATGFEKGYSILYGHGFLDIEAALRPIGPTSMAMAQGQMLSTEAPVLRTGAAIGDAVEASLTGTNLSVRDALSANFSMPAVALTAGARPGPQADRLLLKSLQGNLAAERTADPSTWSEPFADFAGPVLAMTAMDGSASAAVLLSQGGAGSSGVSVSKALTDGPTRVEVGMKLARDNGQLMSLDGDNAAMLASITMRLTQDLGDGAFLALSGEVGATDLGGSTSFGDTGTARFDAVKLTAGRSDLFTKGDRISVGVGMPVAIASGETVLNLPVIREGAAMYEDVALNLAPEDRQLDFDLTYQAEISDGLEMKLSLIRSENYGNRAGEVDTSGALAFALRF